MDNTAVIESEWQYVLKMMPPDLEESAVAKLAITRRREIWEAADLLRLALAYGLCDYSLRETAAWARVIGVGRLSDVAVMRRLQKASAWLGHVVVRWLQERGLSRWVPPLPVRIVDATALCGPGSTGTDWRLHLGLDLAQERITSVAVTAAEGGESLCRHALPADQIVLADRGYGHRAGLAYALEQKAHVLVRLNWQNCPLETRSAEPLDLVTSLELLAVGELGDWPVQFRCQGQTYPLRLIAVRKSQAATEKEQAHMRHEARAKGRQVDRRSLRAAHFIYVVTDLSEELLSAAQALELYRLRWQIEIAFKRLKGLLHLDHLRARQEELARAYLYAKMLGALIIDELYQEATTFFPWGFPLLDQTPQPMARAADAS
jgi:hypothetical protein